MRDGFNSERASVFVIGLGQIGGSIGLGLKAFANYTVLGYDVSSETCETALKIGAVDNISESVEYGVRAADIVVVAVPLQHMRKTFEDIAMAWHDDESAVPKLIMDVGSEKTNIMACATEVFGDASSHFVGGHPMAGSEVMGIRGAKKDMFEGAVWALSFSTNAGEDVRRSAEDFVEVFKSRPLIIEPERHDRIVAATSHVPLLCAAAMATVVGNEAESDELVWALASGGFRDTTRVASGSPKMGAGMISGNVEQIRPTLKRLISALSDIDEILAEDMDGEILSAHVEEFLTKARKAREEWIAFKNS